MTENILHRLHESQERSLAPPYLFQTILKTIHDSVLFIDPDGKITLINEEAQKILNAPIGIRFWDFFPDNFFGFSIKESLFFGISHKIFYRKVFARELEITSTYISDGPKINHGLLVIFRDITEKQSLKLQIDHFERMKQLGEMAASAAHEIRNPLGGIRGYASLLYRDLENQKNLQEMANLIIDGTKALERLVSGVLQFARPLQLKIESVEIGQFLRQLIRFVKVDPACPKGILWQLHIPDDPLIAPIDADAMKSALLNLIFNAFHAMGVSGAITVSLLKAESCYQIAISDTGIGMDESQLKQIFSPFFTTKTKGNGLGLSEVKKIVQAHYGTIEVRSAPQKGSTFTLAFPIKRTPLP